MASTVAVLEQGDTEMDEETQAGYLDSAKDFGPEAVKLLEGSPKRRWRDLLLGLANVDPFPRLLAVDRFGELIEMQKLIG